MISKYSVRKPLTVFVAVVAILVLGVVAYLDMVPDLLPNMDFPYVVIMTTYPGASPEKVESEITRPLNPHSSRRIFVRSHALSEANVPLILLYEHITVHGCASFTAFSKAGR